MHNWPKNTPYTFFAFKVTDNGYYKLKNGKETVAIYRGYAPICLGDEFDDYWEFSIDKNGNIIDWVFVQEHFDEICNYADRNDSDDWEELKYLR